MKKLLLRLLMLISSFGFACQPNEKLDIDSQQLADYLQKNQDYNLSNEIKTVFILTEETCPACNQHFANFIGKSLENTHCLFLILAQGKHINISMFGRGKKNILFDDLQNIQGVFFRRTKAFAIKNRRIVKTWEIQTEKLQTQIAEIEKHILQK